MKFLEHNVGSSEVSQNTLLNVRKRLAEDIAQAQQCLVRVENGSTTCTGERYRHFSSSDANRVLPSRKLVQFGTIDVCENVHLRQILDLILDTDSTTSRIDFCEKAADTQFPLGEFLRSMMGAAIHLWVFKDQDLTADTEENAESSKTLRIFQNYQQIIEKCKIVYKLLILADFSKCILNYTRLHYKWPPKTSWNKK